MALCPLTVVTLVVSGQAVFYVARERRHFWRSVPRPWLLLSSAFDLSIIGLLAANGVLMTALPINVLLALGTAAIAFAFVLDAVKVALFHRLDIA